MSTHPQQEQSLALVKTSPLILELASEWKMNAMTMIDTLKATVFPQKDSNGNQIVVSNAQLMSFLQVANTYSLNPFLRELYAFPTKGGGIVPMVPIDGWANLVNRRPEMDGVEFVDEWEVNDKGVRVGTIPFSTTCIIYRKDRTHATKVTEYFSECNQPTKEPWKKWPARMLRHKAFIQCARIAFSLAGIYDPDEAERIAESGENAKAEIRRPTVIDAKPSSAPAAVQGPVAEDGHSTAKHQPESAPSATQESAPVEPAEEATAEVAAPAFEQGAKCFCSCCKALACDCLSKDEVDQCGCPNCTKYMGLMRGNPEVKGETAPTQSVEASGKPAGPYVASDKRRRLFAVCASKGWVVKDGSHDDDLHKLLKTKFNIDSIAEIPVKMFNEVLNAINPDIKVK